MNYSGAEGAEVVYSLKNDSTLADLVLNNIGDAGQIKRKTYQRRLPENPNKDYYYILRESGNTEPILIEYGFIDNVRDANKLKNNIENYAEAVVKALAEYTNYPYTPPGQEIEYDKYIVKRGDTLYSISKRFNIPINEIKRINSLESDNLNIGQALLLNEKSSTYPEANTYIVKAGDTLYSIALNNNTTVSALQEANNLTNNNLKIGQLLQIPDLLPKPDETTSEYETYTVKKGDSLWQISKKFDIPLPELINLNNLTNLTLQIGDQLIVPKQEKVEDIYVVKSGDTLWSIAKDNNISVNDLKSLNNLNNNLLTIGQELIIK